MTNTLRLESLLVRCSPSMGLCIKQTPKTHTGGKGVTLTELMSILTFLRLGR